MTFSFFSLYHRDNDCHIRRRHARRLPDRSLDCKRGHGFCFSRDELRTGVTVAIKVPHPEAESDVVFYHRFQREEQIGRMMDCPGVIKEISSGPKSRTYLVPEWVDGQLLREVLSREGRLSVDRAVRIAVNICKALEHVHRQGVVHRDLKPENVFVDGRDGIKGLSCSTLELPRCVAHGA